MVQASGLSPIRGKALLVPRMPGLMALMQRRALSSRSKLGRAEPWGSWQRVHLASGSMTWEWISRRSTGVWHVVQAAGILARPSAEVSDFSSWQAAHSMGWLGSFGEG